MSNRADDLDSPAIRFDSLNDPDAFEAGEVNLIIRSFLFLRAVIEQQKQFQERDFVMDERSHKMKTSVLALLVLTLAIGIRAYAQSTPSAPEETPRYNFVIGGGVGFPQGSTGNIVNSGGNFVVGGGVNSHMAGFDAEFMWHDLPPKSSVVALTGAPDGHARLYSVTGNAMLHSSEAHKAGFYGILGIGWYHRSWELTHPTLALGTTCLPSYAFWGVVCTNGLVSANAVINSGSQNAFGWNIGAGLTYRLGQSHVKAYAEARWHYAYFSHFNTKVIPLTFGIRW